MAQTTQKTVVNIRIEDTILEEIERFAAYENRSRSNLIRHLILLGLDAFRDNAAQRHAEAMS